MPEEKVILETKGIPTVYCNQALVSLSYNDVRVYLVELSPSEVIANPAGTELTQKQPLLDPKFSLVLSPEFARSLANALATSVDKYEAIFGKLRPEPTQEQIQRAIEIK